MPANNIVMITSFPPRKCGIATYSQDLMSAIEDKYENDFSIKICALQKTDADLKYPSQVSYILKTNIREEYKKLAIAINAEDAISAIYLQHEFGLFGGELGDFIIDFLYAIHKPVITTFHTVLASPSKERKTIVEKIASLSSRIIVMTNFSAEILKTDYNISDEKIEMIPHGTHLIKTFPTFLKDAIPFSGKIIISTFGLISAGKGIETALEALPRIVNQFPNVLYLIIGKTHPEVMKNDGEIYRNCLKKKVVELKMQKHVRFINKYLSLEVLLEYLQRTDLYFFTSKDPQQAVSGTLVYALSAACPVVSTPIPHSLELLDGAGLNFDFGDSEQLAGAALSILSNQDKMEEMRLNALHRISPTAWQNAAIAHINLIQIICKKANSQFSYKIPEINLKHIHRMTTEFGMIQFAKISEPDLLSGYTIDDNARALIAIAQHFELTGKFKDLPLVNIYLRFIVFCQQENGSFLNYVTTDKEFFEKNKDENLEDANGRTIWALGKFLSLQQPLDFELEAQVEKAFQSAIPNLSNLQSPRAISFSIKGLFFYYRLKKEDSILQLITKLADNLVSKYRGVSTEDWQWYENYLTYGNAVIPEAMLLAGECTGSKLFKEIASKTFRFLMEITFDGTKIKVVSNRGWHHKGADQNNYGEQPIEVAYTILALDSFYNVFKDVTYLNKLKFAFNWFLGGNHLHQIIYNPVTGGCYDGLEEHQVNLNQGAESTLSYLLSRLTIDQYLES